MTQARKLLSIASNAIELADPPRDALPAGPVGEELHVLLTQRNGFYAFESALHVRPATAHSGDSKGLSVWNSRTSWRRTYGHLVGEHCFFAEDAFGHQFAIGAEGVLAFNVETGGFKAFAETIEEWAGKITQDYAVRTGYPVLHDWQVANGAIPPGYRLLARVPFVFGGEYNSSNVVAVRDVALMEYWGAFACSIDGLPDGEAVVFDDARLGRLLTGDSSLL